MHRLSMDAAALAQFPTAERLRALKRIIPKAKIQEILRRTGHSRRRYLRLPAWFMVWFVIALGLFCRDSHRQVFKWLQPFRRKNTPGRSTLCEARQRLGVAPLQQLGPQVTELQATPETPGAFYAGLRLMALDGFVLDVADSPANACIFGRPGSHRSPAAFPQARVLALSEVGTHVLWRTQIKPYHCSEVKMAPTLLRFLQDDMLLLWDRGFLSYQLVQQVIQRGAHLLARVKTNMVFRPLRRLRDGSYLAKLYPSARHRDRDEGGLLVRIIEYTFNDPGRPGSGEKHRLLTTLLDAGQHPAKRLIVLYHERWEEELTIDELKTHQRERPVLRSQTPAGVIQEITGLLLAHYIVRVLMTEAARRSHQSPRRLSFTGTLKVLRCRLPECPKSRSGLKRWYDELLAEIAEEVLPERRNRINPRVIKRKMSNWRKKRAEHRRYPQPTKKFLSSVVILS
jgi:Insertion element 4 transposase N-terminal/Transposase DDE domain